MRLNAFQTTEQDRVTDAFRSMIEGEKEKTRQLEHKYFELLQKYESLFARVGRNQDLPVARYPKTKTRRAWRWFGGR